MQTDYIQYGDCLELMGTLPADCIDMVLCDLPYGLTSCNWDKKLPLSDLWEQYRRIVKLYGAIVLFGRQPFSSELVSSNRKGYKHQWVWDKKQSGSFFLAKWMPLQVSEDILVFTKHGERVKYYPQMREGTFRKRGGAKKTNRIAASGFITGYSNQSNLYYPTNILEFASPRSNRLHPTQKPVALLEYLINTYSQAGEIVLDNCIGSGSTAVACINTDRHFIGYENDSSIYGTAQKRIQKYLKGEKHEKQF